MGAAVIPIVAAVAASAVGSVIADTLAPEPVQAPEPIAPPVPPTIPEQEEIVDPSDVLGEEEARLRDLKRRKSTQTQGGSLLTAQDDDSSNAITLLGGN